MKTNSQKSNPRIWMGTISFALLILAFGPRTASAQQWSVDPNNSNNIYYNSGNVGIGTTGPVAKLEVLGAAYSLPATSGTTQTGLVARFRDSRASSDVVLDVGSAAGTGVGSMWLQVTDARDLSQKYTLLLNPNGGNVGIGTTVPSYKLHVVTTGTLGLALQTSNSTAGNPILDLNDTGRGSEAIISSTDGTRVGTYIASYSNHPLMFATNHVPTQMVLTTAGNVGIGTTSPGRPLTVQAANTGSAMAINGRSDDYGYLEFFRNDGTTLSGAIYSKTDRLTITDGLALDVLTVKAGSVGIGMIPAPNSSYKLDVNGSTNVTGNINVGTGPGTGNINLTGTINAKYQDVAEWVPSSEQITTGTVVVLDSTKSNQVIPSTQAYDTRVAGVVSEQPGLALGESGANKVLVATTGRVRVKVDATNGPIHIGDLLVTSDIPGVAMKSEPIKVGGRLMHMPGTLIGKALEPLEKGSGKILVLLSLQ